MKQILSHSWQCTKKCSLWPLFHQGKSFATSWPGTIDCEHKMAWEPDQGLSRDRQFITSPGLSIACLESAAQAHRLQLDRSGRELALSECKVNWIHQRTLGLSIKIKREREGWRSWDLGRQVGDFWSEYLLATRHSAVLGDGWYDNGFWYLISPPQLSDDTFLFWACCQIELSASGLYFPIWLDWTFWAIQTPTDYKVFYHWQFALQY